MFDKLRRKLRFSIITFIVFSTLVLSISILVYINHMLANDMEIKTSQLSKQYASTISTQMSRIEKAKNLFIAKYNVPEILKSNAYDPYIIGNLSDLKSSNTSIIGSTIVNKNFTYYQDTMLTDKVLSSIFNPNYYEYFENNI
ncbi:MAG: hypothetical protein RR957_06345, partial [Oscillospiraceae bacterium]